MPTPRPQHVSSVSALPSEVGFYITFPSFPDGRLCTVAFIPIDDEARQRFHDLSLRSDNATALDLMTYGELVECTFPCITATVGGSVRISTLFVRCIDPSFRQSKADAATLPGAYIGAYTVQCGHCPEHHALPFLITGNTLTHDEVEHIFQPGGALANTFLAIEALSDAHGTQGGGGMVGWMRGVAG